jgi:hypothetical protein
MAIKMQLKKDDFEILVAGVVTLITTADFRLSTEKNRALRKTQKELVTKGKDLLDRMLAASKKSYTPKKVAKPKSPSPNLRAANCAAAKKKKGR